MLLDLDLVARLSRDCGKVVIAEGGIWSPDELKSVLNSVDYAAVVGTAITRPMDITIRFN